MPQEHGKIDPKSRVAAKGGFFCLTCNRCGCIWYSKNDPRVCSNLKCKSPYWNKTRIYPVGHNQT